MTDEANSGVIEEAAAPVEATEAQPKEAVPTPTSEIQDRNWKEARQLLEEQRRRIEELQGMVSRSAAPAPKEEVDELDQMAPDDIVTAKQMRKYAERVAEQAVQKAMKRSAADTMEERVRARYSDYDSVVTKENVDELTRDDPALRKTLQSLAAAAQRGEDVDPYSLAYSLIKKTKGSTEKEDMSRVKRDADQLAKNSAKPVSSNAIKSAPLSDAHTYANLSKEDKERYFKEMTEAAKRRS